MKEQFMNSMLELNNKLDSNLNKKMFCHCIVGPALFKKIS
jgi:hypothetical protein